MHRFFLFIVLFTIKTASTYAQPSPVDSASLRFEAKIQRIISLWDSLVINHDEIKLVGFEKKYCFPEDSTAILAIYQNDRTYTGYVFRVKEGGMIVRLLPQYKTYNKVLTDSYKGDTVKLSFAPKGPDPVVYERMTSDAKYFYYIVYKSKGKKIRVPAICYAGNDFINSPIFFSTTFYEMKLN